MKREQTWLAMTSHMWLVLSEYSPQHAVFLTYFTVGFYLEKSQASKVHGILFQSVKMYISKFVHVKLMRIQCESYIMQHTPAAAGLMGISWAVDDSLLTKSLVNCQCVCV